MNVAWCRFFVMGIMLVWSTMQAQGQSKAGSDRPQGEGEVSGKILDKLSGKPIEYANVVLLRQRDSVMVTGASTNVHGSFKISPVPFGRYTLVAYFIGFEKSSMPGIVVNPKSSIVVMPDILLQPSSIMLEGTEITAERASYDFQIDKKVVNVGQDIIAAGGTAVDVLENTPSVDVDIEGNVSLRGSSNFSVLVNGRPSVLSGSDALRQIPSSEIKSIEIITNPSAKYDPEGTSGIINVILKKAQENGLSGVVNAGIGSFNTVKGDFLLNYRTSKLNISGGMDYRNEQWKGERSSERIQTFGDTTLMKDASGSRDMAHGGATANIGLDWNAGVRTTLGASAKIGTFTFTRNSVSENFERTNPSFQDLYIINESEAPRTRNYYETNVSLRHMLPGNGHKLDVFGYFSQSRSESDDKTTEWWSTPSWDKLGDPFYLTSALEEGVSSQARLTVDYVRPINGGKLELGYQSRFEKDKEDYRFKESDGIGGLIDNIDLSSSVDFSQDIHSAYTTFSNTWLGMDYQLGLRSEYTNRATKGPEGGLDTSLVRMDFFPTVHISRKLNNDNQLQASYTRRINRPRGWDLDPFISYMDRGTYRKGNPGLEPEYIDSWELGWLKKWGMTFLTVQTYHRMTSNMMTRLITPYDDGIVLYTIENINRDYSTGAEIMLNYEVNQQITFNLSGNLYRYQLKGELYDNEIDKESTNWNTRLNSTIKFNKFSRLQIRMGYRGPTVTAQGRAEGVLTNDLALRFDMLKNRANLVLQVRDPLGTMKRDFTVENPNYYEHMIMRRKSPSFNLSFTYRINNYKPKRDVERANPEDNGGDMNDMF